MMYQLLTTIRTNKVTADKKLSHEKIDKINNVTEACEYVVEIEDVVDIR